MDIMMMMGVLTLIVTSLNLSLVSAGVLVSASYAGMFVGGLWLMYVVLLVGIAVIAVYGIEARKRTLEEIQLAAKLKSVGSGVS